MYELVLVIRPSLVEVKRKKLLETVKSWIKDVKITKEEEWGQKVMSYVIKRETSGYYVDWQFEGEDSVPSDFEKRILGQDDILRHLLIRKK